jgi:hypothetical protein
MNIHSVPDLSFVDKALNRHLRRMRAALRVASSAINAGALQGALGPLCLAGWEAIYGLEVHGLGVNDPLTAIANINGAIHAIYGIEAMLDRLPLAAAANAIPQAALSAIPQALLEATPMHMSHEQLLLIAA